MILPRYAGELLARALRVFPVVVLMGARQTGKSTLVRSHSLLQDRPYLTLDDLGLRGEARDAPEDLVRRAPQLVLDEVQREPNLLLAIKGAVDEDVPRAPGRFVLTGSANLLLMERVSESLAGRAGYVSLWPLTRQELAGKGQPGHWGDFFEHPVERWHDLVQERDAKEGNWQAETRRGGLPVPAYELSAPEDRKLWFDGYVGTYLERDLNALSAIENLPDFRRLMQATCLRLGQLMNQADLGRDVGLPRATVHRYLNLLEASFQLVRLHSYSVNRTRRIIKAPKLYWSDTGLALHLSREENPRGAHLENFILTDLLAWREGKTPKPEILYWRTTSGQEVDFVVEQGDALLGIEVKAGPRPSHRDARHLRVFLDEYPDLARGGLLLHGGKDVFRMGPRILAVPWWRVL